MIKPQPGTKAYKEMQKKLRILYEELFGLRPVYTFGGHITHFSEDVGIETPLVLKFAAKNNLDEIESFNILEKFIDEYRNLGFNVENYIQEDTNCKYEELENYSRNYSILEITKCMP